MHNLPSTLRRARFSLRTLLLVMVIVALAIAQYVVLRRIREVELANRKLFDENVKLRAEAGYLEVDDPRKVAVLRISDLNELTWRWKVWLPTGKWNLSALTQGIPSKDVPDGASVGAVDGGHGVLASATVLKGADGQWQFRATLDDAQIGNALDDAHRLVAPLIKPAPLSGQATDIAGDKVQESFDPKQPVVHIRLRAHQVVQSPSGGWQTKDDAKSSEGIMVWLYRAP